MILDMYPHLTIPASCWALLEDAVSNLHVLFVSRFLLMIVQELVWKMRTMTLDGFFNF